MRELQTSETNSLNSPGNQDSQKLTILRLDNITKVYGMGEVKVYALKDVSLIINQAEYCAIMGACRNYKSSETNLAKMTILPLDNITKVYSMGYGWLRSSNTKSGIAL